MANAYGLGALYLAELVQHWGDEPGDVLEREVVLVRHDDVAFVRACWEGHSACGEEVFGQDGKKCGDVFYVDLKSPITSLYCRA